MAGRRKEKAMGKIVNCRQLAEDLLWLRGDKHFNNLHSIKKKIPLSLFFLTKCILIAMNFQGCYTSFQPPRGHIRYI